MAIAVSELIVYPVKSLRGIPLSQTTVVGGRLQGDREWLLLDADGRFMHQRDYPQMARLRAIPTANGLTVTTAGFPDLHVARPAKEVLAQHVRLWRRLAAVRHVDVEADTWLTSALGLPVRLMAFAPDVPAMETPAWEVHASLQDATPFHLTSLDSLLDLRRRSGSSIPMNRFRPNVVVAGAAPYAEDTWADVRIADIHLHWIKPCTRCKMTMTDQETGERASVEPLRTLATYRRLGAEVVFGHYLTALSDGVLRNGDPLSVLAEHDPPAYAGEVNRVV